MAIVENKAQFLFGTSTAPKTTQCKLCKQKIQSAAVVGFNV